MPLHDLCLRGGTLFLDDPPRLRPGDIAVTGGRISAVAPSIPDADAKATVRADGCIVTPGLVDFHTHVYWGGTPLGVNPDKLAPATGVTTWADMGSAGAGNFEGFVHHVVRRSRLRIPAFLHLSCIGLVSVGETGLRFGELFDPRLADAGAAGATYAAYPGDIRGLKIRIGMESSLTEGAAYLEIALALGGKLGLPVVVHATSAPPGTAQVLARLRPGDVCTHCFAASPTAGILDGRGRILPEVRAARERGVLFDLGYGARSFSSELAAAALDQGFEPDILSSDLHAYSLASTIPGLPDVLSAFVRLGMPLETALAKATSVPAAHLGIRGETGRLREGLDADIAILEWSPGEADMIDGAGRILRGRKLEVRAVYRRGERLEPFDDGRAEAKWKPGLVAPRPGAARTAEAAAEGAAAATTTASDETSSDPGIRASSGTESRGKERP